jgi:hypothetical protein
MITMDEPVCRGIECQYFDECQIDVDKWKDVCKHPDFDETKHSMKKGPCPGFVEYEGEIVVF